VLPSQVAATCDVGAHEEGRPQVEGPGPLPGRVGDMGCFPVLEGIYVAFQFLAPLS